MLKQSIKLAIMLILNLCCDNSENDFYIKNVNFISNGISSTSNIYIEFSNSIDINQFNILNETILDADGEEIEQDFSFALKNLGQNFSYITINGIPHDFWYDNTTNTIAFITTTTLDNYNPGNELLNGNENILKIDNQISNNDGNTLGHDVEYIITKDSQTNITIVPNPGVISSMFSSEGDNIEFHMSGVSEEYVIKVYDMHSNLISIQDNNHIAAELSTYAEWSTIDIEEEFNPGIYKFKLFHEDSLYMQSVIVISH